LRKIFLFVVDDYQRSINDDENKAMREKERENIIDLDTEDE